MTIPELLKWLRTTDGWYVDAAGCLSLDINKWTAPACPGSAPFTGSRCTPGRIARKTGLSIDDACAVIAASDKVDGGIWVHAPKRYDRNLRRRLARACKVRLSERQ